MWKPIDVYVCNCICVTKLEWCVLPGPREALPGGDLCGHKVAALGNN